MSPTNSDASSDPVSKPDQEIHDLTSDGSESNLDRDQKSTSGNQEKTPEKEGDPVGSELSPAEFEMIKHVIDEIVPVHKYLGITLREARKGYAVLHIPFRDELVGDPRFRRWHGGMLATLVDSAGGAAAITTFTSAEDQCSSIDIRVDYMNAGKPLDLLAEGELVRDGNSVLFFRMRVWHEETGEVIAEGRGAYRIRRHTESDSSSSN